MYCFSVGSVAYEYSIYCCSTAKEAATGLVEGGFIFYQIRKHNPEWIDEIKIELEKQLPEKFGVSPMIAPMSAVVCQACK